MNEKPRTIHYAYKRRPRKTHYERRVATKATIQSIKQYILDYREKYGLSPSMREMAAEYHVSTSTVSYYMALLERDGWIRPRLEGVARNIIPVEGAKA